MAAEHQYVVQQAKMFAQFVVNEMKKRFPTDSIVHALAVFDWRSLPNEDVPADQFGRESINQLISHYESVQDFMGTPLQWGKPSQTCRIQLDWEDCRSRLFEARQKFKEEEDKRADRSARTKAQKRERQAAAMDEFYADCLKSDRYCAEFKLLLCCFNCVVLSSVVCETGFSVLKTIKTKARNKLLVVTLDALMCVATLTRLLTQELAHLFMTVSDFAERAYDVWNDGTRCAARSHPGVAHKRRQRHFSMLDTYDSLEWEKKDNEDEDAEVIGACDSDKEEQEEAGEASADDTADVSDSEVVLLTEEQKIEMRKSHGKCLSIRKGWRILSKDEGIAHIQAVGRKKSTRPWKLVHLWDVEGWLEGAVVRRIGRKYETRYPGERPVDHDLRSEEYGPGGWTDEQQQIWIVIVKDSR